MDFAHCIADEHNAAFIHFDPENRSFLMPLMTQQQCAKSTPPDPKETATGGQEQRRDPQWITGLAVPDRVTAEPKVELARSLATANLNLMACEGCSMKASRTGLIGGALLQLRWRLCLESALHRQRTLRLCLRHSLRQLTVRF